MSRRLVKSLENVDFPEPLGPHTRTGAGLEVSVSSESFLFHSGGE